MFVRDIPIFVATPSTIIPRTIMMNIHVLSSWNIMKSPQIMDFMKSSYKAS